MKAASTAPATPATNTIETGRSREREPDQSDRTLSNATGPGRSAQVDSAAIATRLNTARAREQQLRSSRNSSDEISLAKEERKALELESILQERNRSASLWSPEQASANASRHVAAFETQRDQVERGFMRDDMNAYAAANPHYRQVLVAAAPKLLGNDGRRENRPNPDGPDAARTKARSGERATAPSPNGGPEASSDDAREREQARRQALMTALAERYIARGNEYRFRHNEQRIAFEDHGKTLSTSLDSAAIVRGLLDLAEAKGWKTLRIGQQSSVEFRRAVWIEASTRGIQAIGHDPCEGDRKRLEREVLARQASGGERIGRVSARLAQGASPSAAAELVAREAVARGVTDPGVLARVREAANERLAEMAVRGKTVIAKVIDPSTARVLPSIAPSQPEQVRQVRTR